MLYWIVNSQPNFGKTARSPIPIYKFNPLSQQPEAGQSTLVFDALWAMAKDE